MSIIAANTPLVVPVPAGFRLQFGTPISGSCVVTLPDRILTEALTDGEGLGPYQSDASISITSTVPGTCWTIRRDGPTVTLQAAHLAQAPYMPGVSVFIGESASGPATPAGWSGTQFQALVSGAGKATVEQYSTLPGIGASPGSTAFTSGASQTWQHVIGVRQAFYAFRVRYLNPALSAYTPTKVVAKSSATWNSSQLPTGSGSIVTATWSGSTTPATVPAGTGTDVGYGAWSDWMSCPSQARTDVPTAPALLHLRSYFDATAGTAPGYPYSGFGGDIGAPMNNATGLARSFGQRGGDTTTFADTGIDYSSGNTLMLEIEFLTLGAEVRVVGLGDSQTASSSCVDGGYIRYSLPDRVASTVNASGRRPGVTYSALCHGWGSQTYAQITGRLAGILANDKVDVVLLPAGSVNNLFATQSDSDTNMALFLQAVQRCIDAKVKPVVWSIPTRNSANSTNDTLRRAYNAAVQAYCATAGVVFADVASTIGNGASPEQIKTIYDKGDGLHWNAAGVDAVASTIANAMLAAGV